MTRYLAALLLLFAGCLPADTMAPQSFVPALSVLCGVASTAPAMEPEPDTPAVCPSCGGQGWLGDGTIKKDCPDCETPWKQLPPAAPSPERQVIPTEDDAAEHGKAEPQEEASVWYSSYSAAVLDASETGRALRVVVDETQPEESPAPNVGCWLPLPNPPKTFAGYPVPCDLITREFERDADRVTPINLKPYER